MQYVNARTFLTIEDPAGSLDQLPIPPLELSRLGPASGKMTELLDAPKDISDERLRGFGIVERDVIGNGVEIGERGVGPDYPSHRAMRCRALA